MPDDSLGGNIHSSVWRSVLRTKHNMADSGYTCNLVYYPCAVARVRLPLGLPAGTSLVFRKWWICFFRVSMRAATPQQLPCQFIVGDVQPFWQLVSPLTLSGLAPRNTTPRDFKNDVLQKYVPVMQQYGMIAAADYLTHWVSGTLVLEPLLDVSAFLVCEMN